MFKEDYSEDVGCDEDIPKYAKSAIVVTNKVCNIYGELKYDACQFIHFLSENYK